MAEVVSTGHIAYGISSVTGSETIMCPNLGAIKACIASLQNVAFGAGGPWIVQCAPGATSGTIVVTVFDSSGNQATAAAVVNWFASDVG